MDKVSNEELAQAFTAEEPVEAPDLNELKKAAKPGGARKSPKLAIGLAVFIVGLVALAAGVVLLVLNLTKGPVVSDGETLLKAEGWIMCEDVEDSYSCKETEVIWEFTEVGKGTLTTNGHKNDYEFIWAVQDDRLLIETQWLYELENEYKYEISAETGCLILKNGAETYRFMPIYLN